MRTPLVRTLGVAWLCALAITVLGALLTAAVAVMPAPPVPLPLAGAAMLVAAIMALLATPLALAPGHALAVSLTAPEGAPVWGVERADLWGDLARAAAGRVPPQATLPSLADQRAEAAASLLRHAGEVAASLQRDAAAAGAALQSALNGAARIDGAAQHVESRLLHGLRVVEHVSDQLAALRPSDAEAVVVRAGAAVDAMEQAIAALRAVPPPGAALVPGHESDSRIERALIALTDAVGRLAARPDPVAEALPRLEEAAANLLAATAPPSSAERTIAIDPALPDRLDAAVARLERVPDVAPPIVQAVTLALGDALATPLRQVSSATASLQACTERLDTLSARLEAAPASVAGAVTDALTSAERDAALTARETMRDAIAPVGEAVAKLEQIASSLAPLGLTAGQLDSAVQSIGTLPARFEAAAESLATLPLQIEARVSAGAARIQEAAAALGTAAAGAVAATHRATSRAAEELLASAETARAGLANAAALADQATAAQRALRAAAEHLAALGAETQGAHDPRRDTQAALTIPEMLAHIDTVIAGLRASEEPAEIEALRARA